MDLMRNAAEFARHVGKKPTALRVFYDKRPGILSQVNALALLAFLGVSPEHNADGRACYINPGHAGLKRKGIRTAILTGLFRIARR